jgi:PleD family two-component response regulator
VTGAGPAVAAVLSQADRNLYAAKRAGRDRVVADPA